MAADAPKLSAPPLADVRRFSATLERAYRLVWHRWCKLRQAGTPFSTGTLSLSDE